MNKITREEIMKMLAGREMDALIAEKVMGGFVDGSPDEWSDKNELWFYLHSQSGVLIGYPYDTTWNEKNGGEVMYSHSWKTFNPSTDISAAWEVLEFISSKYECSTAVGRDYPFQRETYCARLLGGKLTYDNPELKMYALAETAPLAICRCALLATMESE